MKMIIIHNELSNCTYYYSQCKRFNKDRILIEEELICHGEHFLTHYDINMSWRRFKLTKVGRKCKKAQDIIHF